jgi:hypothetical protein
MSDETHHMNWTSIQIGRHHAIHASTEEPAGSRVQWHPSAHAIFIVKKDMKEVEIRVEREVYEINVSDGNFSFQYSFTVMQYQKAGYDKEAGTWTESCVIRFHLITTRPELSPDIDMRSDDDKTIAIKFKLGDRHSVELYTSFIKWLRSNAMVGALQEVKEIPW